MLYNRVIISETQWMPLVKPELVALSEPLTSLLWRHIRCFKCSALWNILCCFYLFFPFLFTIIYFYSSLPANNAPWSSRFNQGSLFYNRGLHAQGQTCNLYNENHHIFINHHTYPLYFGHFIVCPSIYMLTTSSTNIY